MNAIEKHLARAPRRSWWLLLLRGITGIAFGVLLLPLAFRARSFAQHFSES